MAQRLERLASLLWSPDQKSVLDDIGDLEQLDVRLPTSTNCTTSEHSIGQLSNCHVDNDDCCPVESHTPRPKHRARSRSPAVRTHRSQLPLVCPSYPNYDLRFITDAGCQVDVLINSKNCGKVFSHCADAVERFRQSLGGNLAVFKIGITANVAQRFDFYKEDGFQRMVVIHISDNLGQIEMLEAGLIHVFKQTMGNYNDLLGGDGGIRQRGHEGPYICYVAGARADTMKRPNARIQ